MKWNSSLKETFLKVYSGNGCNVSDACSHCKVSRNSFYEAKKNDPKFSDDLDSCREAVIDNVETALYRTAIEGNVTAQIFMLKTIGKSRGYIETYEAKIETPAKLDFEKLSTEELIRFIELKEKMANNDASQDK